MQPFRFRRTKLSGLQSNQHRKKTMKKDRTDSAGKFLYYIPYLFFERIHLKRPMVEVPLCLQEQGYESTIIMGKKSVDDPIACNVIETGISSHNEGDRGFGRAVNETWRAFDHFRKVDPDYAVFHGNYSPSTLVVMLVRINSVFHRKREGPKITLKLDWDGNLSQYSLLGRTSYLLFIFMSSLLFNRLSIETECAFDNIKNYPLVRQKLIQVPNTVSRDYFPKEPFVNGKRKKLMVSTSVIDEFKGIEDAITSFGEASKEIAGWKFDIIGPVKNTKYYRKLQDQVKLLGLENEISFLGEKDSSYLKELYGGASIFISLSRRESFGIARLEAIACGVPVLTSIAGCGNKLAGAITTDIDDLHTVASDLKRLMLSETLRKETVTQGQEKLVNWDEISKNFVSF